MKKILIVISILVFAGTLSADVELVKNGEPKAEIIIAKQPLASVKVAAHDLQDYIEKISGAKLAIVTKPTEGIINKVYLGKSEESDKLGISLDGMKIESFKIVAKDNFSVEIRIPTDDFGELGPRKPYPWGINVCRMRFAGGQPEAFVISPTGKMSFSVMNKLANIFVK